MSAGLTGCGNGAENRSPAIDLAEFKVPPIRQSTIDKLKAEVAPPSPPVSRIDAAGYIDRLRLDADRKAAAGWELVEAVKQCRAPLEKLASSQ